MPENTYTPDTPHIRSGWIYGAREIGIPEEVAGPQFDRWLDYVKDVQWHRGFQDGERQAAEGDDGPRFTCPFPEAHRGD